MCYAHICKSFTPKRNTRPAHVHLTGIVKILSCFFFAAFFFETIFFVEAVDTSVRLSKFLTSSVEWVTFITNFNWMSSFTEPVSNVLPHEQVTVATL